MVTFSKDLTFHINGDEVFARALEKYHDPEEGVRRLRGVAAPLEQRPFKSAHERFAELTDEAREGTEWLQVSMGHGPVGDCYHTANAKTTNTSTRRPLTSANMGTYSGGGGGGGGAIVKVRTPPPARAQGTSKVPACISASSSSWLVDSQESIWWPPGRRKRYRAYG